MKQHIGTATFATNVGPLFISLSFVKYHIYLRYFKGPLLGPLFSIFMLPLSQIIQNHGVSHHSFADDIQLYVPLQSTNSSSLDNFLVCLSNIKSWMSQNFLKFNDDKSEFIVF